MRESLEDIEARIERAEEWMLEGLARALHRRRDRRGYDSQARIAVVDHGLLIQGAHMTVLITTAQKIPLTAEYRDAAGDVVPSPDSTRTITWSLDNSAVGTLESGTGPSTVFDASAAGTANVSWSDGTLTSTPLTVVVSADTTAVSGDIVAGTPEPK